MQAIFRLLCNSEAATLILVLGPTQAYASTSHSYQTPVSFVWRHMLTSSSVSLGKYSGVYAVSVNRITLRETECLTHLQGEENREPRNHVLALLINLVRHSADLDRLLLAVDRRVKDRLEVSRQTVDDTSRTAHKGEMAVSRVVFVCAAGSRHGAGADCGILDRHAVLVGKVIGTRDLDGVGELPCLLEAVAEGDGLADEVDGKKTDHPRGVECMRITADARAEFCVDAWC
jgi:hypothetical protein